jgi:site-specific DNA-methyltransferase (adenine-specific)
MKDIDDKSIDMILCDLPYGTTACKWDTIIPFEPLWEQYNRIIKDNGAIVLTASEPFASKLRLSNSKMYKYDWIWNKKLAGNGILAKIQPLKIHEIVCIFAKGKCRYNPEMRTGRLREKLNNIKVSEINGGDGVKIYKGNKGNKGDKYYPTSILEFSLAGLRKGRIHPTQKPVALFEYLIKTYTNEGDLVLDNCAGSGTTAIACINTNRNYILMEKEEKYCEVIRKRISEHVK